jgi:hypothetical protein
MTRYDTGDVLLLEFPFTSEAGLKRRPAVVILGCGRYERGGRQDNDAAVRHGV